MRQAFFRWAMTLCLLAGASACDQRPDQPGDGGAQDQPPPVYTSTAVVQVRGLDELLAEAPRELREPARRVILQGLAEAAAADAQLARALASAAVQDSRWLAAQEPRLAIDRLQGSLSAEVASGEAGAVGLTMRSEQPLDLDVVLTEVVRSLSESDAAAHPAGLLELALRRAQAAEADARGRLQQQLADQSLAELEARVQRLSGEEDDLDEQAGQIRKELDELTDVGPEGQITTPEPEVLERLSERHLELSDRRAEAAEARIGAEARLAGVRALKARAEKAQRDAAMLGSVLEQMGDGGLQVLLTDGPTPPAAVGP